MLRAQAHAQQGTADFPNCLRRKAYVDQSGVDCDGDIACRRVPVERRWQCAARAGITAQKIKLVSLLRHW